MGPEQPTYTDTQLEIYLTRLAYVPAAKTGDSLVQDVRHRIETDAFGTLSELQRRHLAAIPWGNSGLHYSQHHTISLHPESLFEKMVERRLDGYCMENTGIFLIVLRSLGYVVYATGARVSQAAATRVDNGLYSAFEHMVLIVTIDGAKYMVSARHHFTNLASTNNCQVDVGFGNNCATAPLHLHEGATATWIGRSEMRLIRESIAEFTDKSQKVWIYQTRYNPESSWLPNICFSEVEFLPQDFGMMNFSVSQKATSWFKQTFVCMRMILSPTGKEIIGQCIMAGKEVKRRIHGQTEILQVLQSEEDRVQALAKYFDMHLRDSEIHGIQGLTSQLK
ncbi:uncharacterized protein N7482_007864 [Penicillium canariense]|uniref:Arylamine N-acetyltransferase n=1 Tax=Penicillium canariense TaxID=189055 RepID=A0A9W9I0G0_9EURO|nr:uncharacterized protein N7482_007864 [Penicillium canariense]KAJ5160860.1 hypothetical protein N7482_007864 [Penicillium canariense]